MKVRAETLKLGQLCRVASGHILLVTKHIYQGGGLIGVEGEAIGTGRKTNFDAEGIRLTLSQYVDLVDADFFVDDECVARTYSKDALPAVDKPEPEQKMEWAHLDKYGMPAPQKFPNLGTSSKTYAEHLEAQFQQTLQGQVSALDKDIQLEAFKILYQSPIKLAVPCERCANEAGNGRIPDHTKCQLGL